MFGFVSDKKMVRKDNGKEFLDIECKKDTQWYFVVYIKDYGDTEIVVSFD